MFFVTEVVTPVDCAIKYAVYVTVMLAPGVEVPEKVIVYWQGEHVALPLMFNVCAGAGIAPIASSPMAAARTRRHLWKMNFLLLLQCISPWIRF
jgi:hypothetical protein